MNEHDKSKIYLDEFHNIKGMDSETYRIMGARKSFVEKADKWNKINNFKDCPPLNKEVMAIHDGNIYMAVFEKDGDEGFCWRLKDERGIQWVGIYEVEYWLE